MGGLTRIANGSVTSSIRRKKRNIDWLKLLAPVAFGVLLGLSAPGIGLWPLAWFGLAPLIVLVLSCRRKHQAVLAAFVFGLAYNCIYMNWYLGLAPLDWLGFNNWQSNLMAMAALFITSIHQALIIAIFAFLCRLLPLKSQLFIQWKANKLRLPAQWTVPLLWILIVNKLGNAHWLTGVPWSMLEYSQYKQLPVIQVASLIGGLGVGYLIVLVNVTLAIIFAAFTNFPWSKNMSAPHRRSALSQGLATAVVLFVVLGYGFWQLSKKQADTSVALSVLQPNVNIDMQKSEHRYSVSDLLNVQEKMLAQCPSEVCVWSESSIPARLPESPQIKQWLSKLAKKDNLDLIVGSIDRDSEGKVYNAVFAVRADGSHIEKAYRKRYLVPFGEYTPELVHYMPDWVKRLTNTPAGEGYASGSEAVSLNLSWGKVAPLICFETISPELAAQSVREGGQLLVNLSDLAWFHQSIIGEQMIACAVFRAIENQRFFVFAANTGPSAIITPSGAISSKSKQGVKTVLTGKVGFISALSPFSRWFTF